MTALVVSLPLNRTAAPWADDKPAQPKLTIRSVLGSPVVTVPYAPQGGTRAGVAAVYARQPRPGRADSLTWQYAATPTLNLDLTFRRYSYRFSVEGATQVLDRLAGGFEAVLLHGCSPTWAGPWYITDLSWEVVDLVPGTNQVAQAIAHTTFTRTPRNELQALGPVHGGVKVQKSGTKNYRVKRGDTLPKIAARELGDSSLWGLIATFNHLRNMRIHVGQRLKLPRGWK